MPVDFVKLREIAEVNDQITDEIRVQSSKLEELDPKNVLNTAEEAKKWSAIVMALKASLEEQKQCASEMSESAKDKDLEQAEAFHEKYRFLVERLKADVRHLFGCLKDSVDLPEELQPGRKTEEEKKLAWEGCDMDLEMELKGLSAAAGVGKDMASIDPLVHLLNYRDAIAALILGGLLFRKAVLDWDLKSERNYADGPMVAMSELAVNIYSKTENLPYSYRPAVLPKTSDVGQIGRAHV
eukprot:TRINITY_DN7828_c0_g1_i2.p1 TRINITY_DN7828_c0_g1~~TRINITY_DN7828_c0_g1_i2.p1  ORF type:complete len:240 (-),score=71.36 TRINITY_DN7828_c0_g1_i2:30-749(-)